MKKLYIIYNKIDRYFSIRAFAIRKKKQSNAIFDSENECLNQHR